MTTPRFLSITLLIQIVTGLLTIALVAMFALNAFQATERLEQAGRVPVIVAISDDLFTAIQGLRTERATVNASLATADAIDRESLREIATLRSQSAAALDSALLRLATIRTAGIASKLEEIGNASAAIELTRHEVDEGLVKPSNLRRATVGNDWAASNGRITRAIEGLSTQLETEIGRDDRFIAEMMRIKQIVWRVRSDSGDDRLLLRHAILRGGRPSEAQLQDFAAMAGRIQGFWDLVKAEGQIPTTPAPLRDAIASADTRYFVKFGALRNAVVADLVAGKKVAVSPRDWLKLSVPGRESIFLVAKSAFDVSGAHANEQYARAKRDLYAALASMIGFTIVGLLMAWYVYAKVARPMTKITDTIRIVADGNLTCEIPFEDRRDEIGLLARALRVFRDNAVERQQLYVAKAEAEAASRTKSQFLANMSHELRTPLNAIIGFSQVLKMAMFGPLNERYRSYGTDIFDSGNHLLGLINGVLDLSKLEAQQLELYIEDIDPAVIIRTSKRLIEDQAKRSNIRLVESIANDIPLMRADDQRMRQVLINLLSNAVKFTPEGGMVRISCYGSNGGVKIAVSDTGIGIAPDKIPKALEPFGQIASAISRKHAGTGLGLPLAKHLVELHGGTLTIESKVNVGTTVTICLPPECIVERAEAGALALATTA